MVVTGGPDGAIPQSPAVRRRNGFAEACSVRCGAGASPATPTASDRRSRGSAASSATPPATPAYIFNEHGVGYRMPDPHEA